MLQIITWLTLDLLWEGYFVRGAVVKGPLYHDDRIVFGKALVDAYYYESEIAKYPRVIVVREVREDILKAQPALMKLLKQAEDGPMFLDVLRFVRDMGTKAKNPTVRLTEREQHLHSQFNTIGSRLQERFEQSMDNPRHFEKVRWFAKYWNDAIVSARLNIVKFSVQVWTWPVNGERNASSARPTHSAALTAAQRSSVATRHRAA